MEKSDQIASRLDEWRRSQADRSIDPRRHGRQVHEEAVIIHTSAASLHEQAAILFDQHASEVVANDPVRAKRSKRSANREWDAARREQAKAEEESRKADSVA